MKEKELINTIRNTNFSWGMKLNINNFIIQTNNVLASEVIYCCLKTNNLWQVFDEGPEDKSEPKEKYIYFESTSEEDALDFFYKRIMRHERIYGKR